MNPIPEKIRMMLLERAWTIGVAAEYLADFRVLPHPGDSRAESQRRAREAGRAGRPCQLEDRDGIGERAGHRLVDEHWLVRLQDGLRLLEMGPAVDALEQHNVDPRK